MIMTTFNRLNKIKTVLALAWMVGLSGLFYFRFGQAAWPYLTRLKAYVLG